jgi:CRISPR type III-A-associated RAMP protein Csm5
MTKEKETGIIELETLVPLFIKDKDPEYGEGVYPIGDKIYLLDNDKLCEFLYEQTYDEEGNLRLPGSDYVDEYSKILQENYRSHDLRDRSIKSFLERRGLISGNPHDAEQVVRKLAKGVTRMADVRGSKRFIVNGMGECYIPGSSIRGAIRNALLWAMLKENPCLKTSFDTFVLSRISGIEREIEEINLKRDLSRDQKRDLVKKKKKDVVEKFGTPSRDDGVSLSALTASRHTPTYQGPHNYVKDDINLYNTRWANASEMHRDLFRILKISDAAFIGSVQTEAFKVATYKLEPGNGGDVFQFKEDTRIPLNGVGADVKARFRMTIDKALAAEIFSGSIPNYLNSVPELLKAVNGFFRTLASEEQEFFSSAYHRSNVGAVKDWYTPYKIESEGEIVESPLLFRIGWGGGLMSKTQFLHLSTPDRKKIRNLTTDRGSAVAPKSRCLHENGNNVVGPLGWCTLRYIGTGKEEYFNLKATRTAERPQPACRPQNSVKATIVDVSQKPAKIRIEEGSFKGIETSMRFTLQCLQLTQGSEIWVNLDIVSGKLQRADFWGTV